MSDPEEPRTEQQQPEYVINQRAEVLLEHNDDVILADRVEILPGGMVKLVFKKQYSKKYYPREQVEGIFCHTTWEEGAEWW